MLDLHEIVDISEEGHGDPVSFSPRVIDSPLNLCLDLADIAEHIYTTGQVIWSNQAGRAGVRFSVCLQSLSRLREWLFVNVMAGVANGEAEIAGAASSKASGPPRPSYTDALATVTAVQRQVEALGSDLPAALRLIAERSQALVRASGPLSRLPKRDLSSWFVAPVPGVTPPDWRATASRFRLLRRVCEEWHAAALRRRRSRCPRRSGKLS